MAEFESKKKGKKSPKKKDIVVESSQNKAEKNYEEFKRKEMSSSDDEFTVKKPKVEVTNGQVAATASSSTWSFEEEEALLENVGKYLTWRKGEEGAKKTIYIKDIDWSKIDPCGHTFEDAQHRFITISNRVRKMRTAMEILQDMKSVLKKRQIVLSSSSKKKDVDPDVPKKPHAPYILFTIDKRHEIAEKHPELNNQELTRELGRQFTQLSEEKKKKYEDQYHEEMESYNEQIIDYLKANNPDICPPKTKFQLWADDESVKIKQERPDISEKRLAKKLKRRWDNLEEHEKLRLKKLEKNEVKKFRKKISSAKKRIAKQKQIQESSSEDKN